MSAGYLAKCSNRTTGQPKKRHETQALAEEHRLALIKRGKWTLKGSNTYFCIQCGSYHAGQVGRNNHGGGKRTAKRKPRFLDTQ